METFEELVELLTMRFREHARELTPELRAVFMGGPVAMKPKDRLKKANRFIGAAELLLSLVDGLQSLEVSLAKEFENLKLALDRAEMAQPGFERFAEGRRSA